MTASKRPPTYGDAPSIGGRRGAPLPLVTQPMMPTQQDPSETRVDQPLATVNMEQAIFIGKPTVELSPQQTNAAKAMVVAMSPPQPRGQAPQIDLTQHHLPDERPDPRLVMMIDPDSERSAQFRVLRHHLLEVGRPQCVIVSSPNPGEGKTTAAMNLALALAECGRAKVLLAETHVRRPALAQMLRFVPPWCFAEQLATHRGQPMMPWSLVDIPQMWLHVAAINPRIDKSQLLDGPAFQIGMERLRAAGYDHIIVDAPPVLGSADVNLMADAADTVLLALRSTKTTARELRRAIDQLGASKVVGTVLME